MSLHSIKLDKSSDLFFFSHFYEQLSYIFHSFILLQPSFHFGIKRLNVLRALVIRSLLAETTVEENQG